MMNAISICWVTRHVQNQTKPNQNFFLIVIYLFIFIFLHLLLQISGYSNFKMTFRLHDEKTKHVLHKIVQVHNRAFYIFLLSQ